MPSDIQLADSFCLTSSLEMGSRQGLLGLSLLQFRPAAVFSQSLIPVREVRCPLQLNKTQLTFVNSQASHREEQHHSLVENLEFKFATSNGR